MEQLAKNVKKKVKLMNHIIKKSCTWIKIWNVKTKIKHAILNIEQFYNLRTKKAILRMTPRLETEKENWHISLLNIGVSWCTRDRLLGAWRGKKQVIFVITRSLDFILIINVNHRRILSREVSSSDLHLRKKSLQETPIRSKTVD